VSLDQAVDRTAPGIPVATSTVAVVGLGYVGLPTAICLANSGRNVIGIDISEVRLSAITEADVDLPEPDRNALRAHLHRLAMTLTADIEMVSVADAVIVCVPTPIDSHQVPDLGPLEAACRAVVQHARPGQTVILTSTTFVGCTREFVAEPLAERGLVVGRDVHVAFSPERIDPGNTSFAQNVVPRVVGGVTAECERRAADLVQMIAGSVHVVASPEVAEAAKLLENSFRAVNIAFINEIADACSELGLDVIEVIRAAATKPYGFMPFYPGPGVGGHCIPCDPHYLLWQLRARRTPLPLTETAMTAIAVRPRRVVDRACQALAAAGTGVAGAKILLVGIAYKPGVRDLRESPALEIMDELLRRGAHVDYIDPMVDCVAVGEHVVSSTRVPSPGSYDLVVVNTLHPGEDYSWLRLCNPVLDASYRAVDVPHRLSM
jgi:nucleotide sugar dehydrogenase